MKRVGIYTYMLNNYGAVLQAYALQTFLSKYKNCEVEIINFKTDKHLRADRLFKPREGLLRNLVFVFLTLLHYCALSKRRKRTHKFKQDFYNLSQTYSSVDELLSNPPKKDIHVSGSDQVFNPTSEYMPIYYLQFPKGDSKKVAYAPSFGISKFTQQQKESIRNFICDFDALSCREVTGANLLSELTGKEIPVVVDPTLLLSSSDWSKIAVQPNIKVKYIFVYDLNGGNNLIHIAKRIQQVTGYKIICVTGNIAKFYKGCTQVYSAGPCEFVGWFKNAEYVVTDSFHGTMFSLIWGKPFFTYIATMSSATRIYSILSQLGLRDRIVENGKVSEFTYNQPQEFQAIDYSRILVNSIRFINNEILNEKIQ
ncbi:polysaccharide pyruvyl transferase family protein [Parabacteroides sp. TM07-1AC]|uniref:polysaccharide pyruvyl transferase family protein n=1 Tax=Parabacteroides sp. TM07-1AC TaxID=2292363 RepID=UPI0011C4683A|nr:polysaccharide pyruvyl transferase family protein [Parabacteroides sp. TM07-1AC]